MLLKRFMLAVVLCSAFGFSHSESFAEVALEHKAPESVANLASGLLDAVVNISTSQTVKGTEQGDKTALPKVEEGAPFQEYFNDFFSPKNDKSELNQSRKVQSLGSGFVIDAEKGLIVTNNHVIADADEIEVNFTDGSKLKAKLLGKDAKTDLALLQVDPKAKKLTAVSFGDSDNARIGDWVMAIGNPFGLGGTVTVGIISARNRDISAGPYDDFIQTDAAINRGNSGGPLFDMNGKVIGINTAIISPSGGSIGIGFAIPSDMATSVLDQLKEFGETRRGSLAIRIQPVTQEIADSLKLPKAQGALVAGKIDDKTVDNSQLKDGDVIIRFGNHTIKDARELPRIVAESPVGKIVDVTILRNGQEKSVKVKLGRLKEKEVESDSSADNDHEGGNKKADEADTIHAMGMTLSEITDELRKRYHIKDGVDGVLVTEVSPNSAADEKRIRAGEVIVDINQQLVKTPEDVSKQLEQLRANGRKNALLMVAGEDGELRFVTLRLD
ncbi:Do family serine endopeptidase [Bartonella sp. B10834H15]|uniref:Do family serine endopeptidase n=2 Tax=Bartonella TaxID=773 RepID=UPI0018DE56CE|nr:Do family serine endopeptidase [Bartonella choladocola]MBH9975307.1 Do family serine endopeptidase [Bartonella choladocola]MBI0014914.1 Do family serine endopeptidase [Bartonella sp. B10834G3]